MFRTTQQAEHFIRTTFGDSTLSINGRNLIKPYQGILQGNGAGPVTWMVVNAPMIEVQRKKGFGVKFHSAISKDPAHVVGFVLVDDADLGEGNLRPSNDSLEDVADRMQRSIDQWEGSLKTSGGAIRPDKSFAYPIDFTFKASGEPVYERL